MKSKHWMGGTNENVKTLGERLYELRSEKHMTQEELAERLLIGRQTISKWELNKLIPSTENLIQLAEIYEVSLDYLIKGQISAQDVLGDIQQDNSKDITDEIVDETNEIKKFKKSKGKIIFILTVMIFKKAGILQYAGNPLVVKSIETCRKSVFQI